MRPSTFIMNSKKAPSLDSVTDGTIKTEWYNTKAMSQALEELYNKGNMGAWELRQAKSVLKDCAKPIVMRMKSLAPKSSRQTSITMHRAFRKGQATLIKRKHGSGELRKSIGVITRSRKYRKIPMIYVGVRRGVRYANSGYHAEVAEHGRKTMYARKGKFLFFANKDGSVVKKSSVAGFKGRKYFKRAMDSERDKALENALNSFAFWFGGIWENPGAKATFKKV